MKGYFLRGARDEYLLVLRGEDVEIFEEVIDRLSKMRSRSIKALADELRDSLEAVKDD